MSFSFSYRCYYVAFCSFLFQKRVKYSYVYRTLDDREVIEKNIEPELQETFYTGLTLRFQYHTLLGSAGQLFFAIGFTLMTRSDDYSMFGDPFFALIFFITLLVCFIYKKLSLYVYENVKNFFNPLTILRSAEDDISSSSDGLFLCIFAAMFSFNIFCSGYILKLFFFFLKKNLSFSFAYHHEFFFEIFFRTESDIEKNHIESDPSLSDSSQSLFFKKNFMSSNIE